MAEKSFILFESCSMENKYDRDGCIIPGAATNYIYYRTFKFNQNIDFNKEIGKWGQQESDPKLDPENISIIDPLNFCKNYNDIELLKINELLNICKEFDSGNKYSVSLNSKRVMFLEHLRGEFDEWYRKNKLSKPNVELGKIKKTKRKKEKIIWSSGRGDWAHYIVKKWKIDVNDNLNPQEKEYTSLADCVRKNYKRYKFNFKWSERNAISLTRKYSLPVRKKKKE